MADPFGVGDIVEPAWYPGPKGKVLAVAAERFGREGRLEQVITVELGAQRTNMRAAHFRLVRKADGSGS